MLGVNAYAAQWINPRTGERQVVTGSGAQALVATAAGIDLPDRPDAEDWVLLLRKR